MKLKREFVAKSKVVYVEILDDEIEIYNSQELKKEIQKEIDEGQDKLIIDLKNVNYMDSSGIGVLVTIHKLMKASNGRIVISGVKDQVKSVLQMTKIDKFFVMADSKEKALDLLKN